MKINLLFIPILTALLMNSSCSNTGGKEKTKEEGALAKDTALAEKRDKFIFDCADLKRQAQQMDSNILKQTEVNPVVAGKVIKAFTEFAYHCASDSTAPVYLIKTAQIARSVNNIPQAKVVLEKCINDYPNFKNRPAAIFLLAQLYDDAVYLDNEEQAKVLYQKIIDEYPKSDWVLSAKGALKFIGKTDEQIIEEFKKRKK